MSRRYTLSSHFGWQGDGGVTVIWHQTIVTSSERGNDTCVEVQTTGPLNGPHSSVTYGCFGLERSTVTATELRKDQQAAGFMDTNRAHVEFDSIDELIEFAANRRDPLHGHLLANEEHIRALTVALSSWRDDDAAGGPRMKSARAAKIDAALSDMPALF